MPAVTKAEMQAAIKQCGQDLTNGPIKDIGEKLKELCDAFEDYVTRREDCEAARSEEEENKTSQLVRLTDAVGELAGEVKGLATRSPPNSSTKGAGSSTDEDGDVRPYEREVRVTWSASGSRKGTSKLNVDDLIKVAAENVVRRPPRPWPPLPPPRDAFRARLHPTRLPPDRPCARRAQSLFRTMYGQRLDALLVKSEYCLGQTDLIKGSLRFVIYNKMIDTTSEDFQSSHAMVAKKSTTSSPEVHGPVAQMFGLLPVWLEDICDNAKAPKYKEFLAKLNTCKRFASSERVYRLFAMGLAHIPDDDPMTDDRMTTQRFFITKNYKMLQKQVSGPARCARRA